MPASQLCAGARRRLRRNGRSTQPQLNLNISVLIGEGTLHAHGEQHLGVRVGFCQRGKRVKLFECVCICIDFPGRSQEYNFPLLFFLLSFEHAAVQYQCLVA